MCCVMCCAEFQALAEIIGPYGIRFMGEKLMEQVSTVQYECLPFVTAHLHIHVMVLQCYKRNWKLFFWSLLYVMVLQFGRIFNHCWLLLMVTSLTCVWLWVNPSETISFCIHFPLRLRYKSLLLHIITVVKVEHLYKGHQDFPLYKDVVIQC